MEVDRELRELEKQLVSQNLKIALLEQNFARQTKELDSLKAGINRGLWIIGGGFLSGLGAWVMSGGLLVK